MKAKLLWPLDSQQIGCEVELLRELTDAEKGDFLRPYSMYKWWWTLRTGQWAIPGERKQAHLESEMEIINGHVVMNGHGTYKGMKHPHYCLDCGKAITSRKAKFCAPCRQSIRQATGYRLSKALDMQAIGALGGRPRNPVNREAILALARQGWGCKRIVSELGAQGQVVSFSTVYRIIKRGGM